MNVLTILIDLQVASEARKTKSRKPCPLPVSTFTGQQGILEKMHQLFNQNQGSRHIFVLHGLGGSGKSQIALKFVEEAQANKRFSDILFVDATSEQTAETDLKLLASIGSADTAQEGLQWLASQQSEWLLLFDNADDTQLDIGKFFPPCSFGNIIITTRNPEVCMHAELCPNGEVFRVADLKIEDAKNLLLKLVGTKAQAPNKEELATAIVKELHCFALAVAQAGGYIYTCGKLNIYLKVYKSSRDRLLAQSGIQAQSQYALAVYATWDLSYKKLSSPAQTLLQICSQLHHQNIREEIFQRAILSDEKLQDSNLQEEVTELLAQIGGGNKDCGWDSLVFSEVTRELQSYSLIEQNQLDDSYTVHPLVQQWSALSISKNKMKEYVLAILGLSVPWRFEMEAYQYRYQILNHIMQNLELFLNSIDKAVAPRIALVLYDQGHFHHAEQLEVAALEASKQLLGEEHPDTLDTMANLASTYWRQGRWSEAEQLQVTVLEARKWVLGKEHPNTLDSMADLASTYWRQGRWSEAEQLEVAVLETRKWLLGPQHPDTLFGMASLASTYHVQGRWSEAEELEVLVLEARKQVLGKEHPNTLDSMANLASTYWRQGRWSKAEQLQGAVLEARKRVLGKEHPDTLRSMANLACTYRDQGRLNEAEQLEVTVLEARKQLLEKEHPDTLTSMASLASTYQKQGQWSEAEQLEVTVLKARKRLLGEEHPDTLFSMANLACTYRDQGRLNEAEQLEVTVLEARKRVLGKEHPDTLRSMANLASTYQNQGRLNEAEELEVAVLEARKQVLGKEHPDTLTSMASLAHTLESQCCFTEAQALRPAAKPIEG
ncbi:P-loop containing nucleoside triphosphate hydrolase protein [Favolaschia claudopus]|uniref:P-loop containing nucleoside triphosphate hydrolase protein n=1 Tax=Favolaschia claudopus TaxID=2862362 RepID=A0AAW0CHF5_9AGAR